MNPSQPPVPSDESPDGLPAEEYSPSEPVTPQPGEAPPAGRPAEPVDEGTGGQRLWQLLQDQGELSDTKPSTKQVKAPEWMTDQPKRLEEAKPTPAFSPPSSFSDPNLPTENIDLRDKESTSAQQEGISRIQRILSDPDMIEDEVDYRPEVQDGDFDHALRNYYRDSSLAIMCKNHTERSAVDQCPECSAYYCQECIVVRRGRLLCRDCAETIFLRTEDQIISDQAFGESSDQTEVMPEEKPEFQVSGGLLGVDGRPAHPLKKLVALALDVVLSRCIVLFASWVVGFIFDQNPGAFFHLFDSTAEPLIERVINAAILYRPLVPWLIIFIVADFLYFFITLSFFNRTFGMSWLNCRIVSEWGDFANFSTVALRVLVFMVFLAWPAILISWFLPGFRGPHDYAAGTIVINYSGNKRIDAYDSVQIRLD